MSLQVSQSELLKYCASEWHRLTTSALPPKVLTGVTAPELLNQTTTDNYDCVENTGKSARLCQ